MDTLCFSTAGDASISVSFPAQGKVIVFIVDRMMRAKLLAMPLFALLLICTWGICKTMSLNVLRPGLATSFVISSVLI